MSTLTARMLVRAERTTRRLREPLPGHLQRMRRHAHEHPDAGTTTEQVIITALLAAAAIAIIGIIVAKITARANSIDLGG